MAMVALLLVLAGALLAGASLGSSLLGPEDGAAFRWTMRLAAGLVALHLVLAWLDLAGVSWHPLVVLGVVAAVALACRWWSRTAASRATASVRRATTPPGVDRSRPPGAGPWLSRLDWASLAGFAVVGYFAVLAASQRIAFPDFVYHWGLKGHRYFLLRGIDYDFLGREWNLVAHRDYPQLVPELYALQSIVAGRFSEPTLLLWSAVFFAALLVAARQALAAWSVREEIARPVLVILMLAIGVFAVGHQMAGSVDWIVALALTAALPALHRPPSARGELQLGVLAALAASSKLEGIPLAALLIGAGLWRRWRGVPAGRAGAEVGILGAAARLAGPSMLAITPWLIQGLRHDLFRDPQSGAFAAGRAPAIAAAVWQSTLRPEWHFVPLVLLLLPLLFLGRETRLVGTIIGLQLGGYLLRYFTASFDYEFSVLSSFPRLAFHLVPAVVLGLAAAGEAWAARRRPGRAGDPFR